MNSQLEAVSCTLDVGEIFIGVDCDTNSLRDCMQACKRWLTLTDFRYEQQIPVESRRELSVRRLVGCANVQRTVRSVRQSRVDRCVLLAGFQVGAFGLIGRGQALTMPVTHSK